LSRPHPHPLDLAVEALRSEVRPEILEALAKHLATLLTPPHSAVRVLGSGAVDELRQDVLMRLLADNAQKLRAAAHPRAYARRAFQHALTSQLRKWGPRQARHQDVRDVLYSPETRSPESTVASHLDAHRALEIAESLDGKGRLAVLLLVQPQRVSNEDWTKLVSSLPPPPPQRPADPVSREVASAWLFPPQGPETAARRRQRLNSFDKSYKRALARIRIGLETP